MEHACPEDILRNDEFRMSEAKLQASFLGWAAAKIADRDGESDRTARPCRPPSFTAPRLNLTQHSIVRRVKVRAKFLQCK
eukprot:8838813-Pyramimonas_sp.AAC.1